MLTDKQLWVVHIVMVTISAALGTITFSDYFDPTTSKLILQSLLASYMVLGFVSNGVMPPGPPQIPPAK